MAACSGQGHGELSRDKAPDAWGREGTAWPEGTDCRAWREGWNEDHGPGEEMGVCYQPVKSGFRNAEGGYRWLHDLHIDYVENRRLRKRRSPFQKLQHFIKAAFLLVPCIN